MNCPKCFQDIKIQVGTNVKCEKCKILTSLTSILTVQCEQCKEIFQVSVQSKSFLSVKENK